MKSYYTFEMLGRENIVKAGSVTAIVKLEILCGLHFEPTGLNDDSFGKSYIEQFSNKNGTNVWEFADLKKYISWRLSIGEKVA